MKLEAKTALRLQFLVRVVQKECRHLITTDLRLFENAFTSLQVMRLETDVELAEQVDAFVGRFSRFQDHLGGKLLPSFAKLMGESPKSLLDVLAYAEKVDWLEDAENFVNARKLRNLLVHELFRL